MAENLSRRNDQPKKMNFSIRTLMLLTLRIAFCFGAQPWIGLGSSIALGVTCVYLFSRQSILAIVACYFAFLLLPVSLSGLLLWLFISIVIFSWPWLETVLKSNSQTNRRDNDS